MTIAVPGDFGKPRPALIIQSDRIGSRRRARSRCCWCQARWWMGPLIRATVEPSAANGLRKRSEVMVDKAMSVRRDRVGSVVGRLDPEAVLEVSRALAVFLGIA